MKVFREKCMVAFYCLVLLLMFAAGCSRDTQQFGQAIDPQATTVTLADLVAKPDIYEGKDVVVAGHFAGACGDGDFYFKDKFEIIEADPPSSDIFRLEKGTPIRLYGLVKVQRSGGRAADKTGEAAAGEEAQKRAGGGQVYVKIVSKGAEVIP